ncbi:MAG: feoA [Gammaproteobacteria bacterium]|jgi:ferrous iron transport protein A|nr:feoA [Gammaproteobacteria bacterium]
MRLKDMKIGVKARIVRLSLGKKGYRHRLISMGLIPGTELMVSQIAPLGDPIKIQVRGFILSLRKEEAHILELEEVAV